MKSGAIAKPLVPALMLVWLAAIAGSGPLVAAENCYRADHDSGSLEFSGVQESSSFTGRFESFVVEYCMTDGDPETGTIDVRVETGSANTRNRDRDGALRQEEFFYVDSYPEARWTSSEITRYGDEFQAEGVLEIRGIDRDTPVSFVLEADGDDWKMTGGSKVRRLDFNVGTGDEDLEDTEFIRNEVEIAFELRLAR